LSKSLYNQWLSQKDKSSNISIPLSQIKKIKSKAVIKKVELVHQEVFEEIDCLQCANCCKSIPPIVSSRDSKRIAQSLGMTKAAFEDTYITIDNDGDRVINASPCPFLMEDNKCRVYEVRPAACRQYPHSGDMEFFKHLSLHKRNAKYCPALYEIIRRVAKIAQ
jgi:Fe-S-cluster containining protein